MQNTLRGRAVDRGELAEALTQFARLNAPPISLEEFALIQLPEKGAVVGSWNSTSGDPLAEILVVRDEDYLDTFAWLNSFFPGLAPVTQWCRVLSQSQAAKVARRQGKIGLGSTLSAWVGAIMAECSVQAGGISNLRDISGLAAISCSSFAAGRAAAVWGEFASFDALASRHDQMSRGLREGARPLSADSLVPLWATLGAIAHPVRDLNEQHGLEPIASILRSILRSGSQLDAAELVQQLALDGARYLNLPELIECARGPQNFRVQALDRLGDRLKRHTDVTLGEAVLGLGASFVDPGSSVSPDLLRRHSSGFPLAPLWLGVFAGALMPFRVLTDHAGLGRQVAKALLASSDLEGRPSCDIAFDEISRWLAPGRPLKLDVRSMSPRMLSIELVTGVSCTFALGRNDASASIGRVDPYPRNVERSREPTRSMSDVGSAVEELSLRVSRLENALSNPQRSLDLEPRPTKPGRKSSKVLR